MDTYAGVTNGVMIVTADMAIRGSIRRCRRLEVTGYVEGEVVAQDLIVHPGGRIIGKLKSGTAAVAGIVRGDVVVDGLLRIADSGSVAGTVQYGKLAMEAGADLDAEVRNIPPRLEGDFEISVERGRQARITPADISAVDPDDPATKLMFTVSNAINGSVQLIGGGNRPAATFTQADLVGGRVSFAHDGSETSAASFDVAVTDASGATSGDPKTVKVTVVQPASRSSLW